MVRPVARTTDIVSLILIRDTGRTTQIRGMGITSLTLIKVMATASPTQIQRMATLTRVMGTAIPSRAWLLYRPRLLCSAPLFM